MSLSSQHSSVNVFRLNLLDLSRCSRRDTDYSCVRTPWKTHVCLLVSLSSTSKLIGVSVLSEVMYVNLYGNSATLQTLYLLQGKLGKSARRSLHADEGLQISNSGSTQSYLLALPSLHRWQARSWDRSSTIPVSVCISYTVIWLTPVVVMKSIVDSNREVLKDPVGTRIVRRLARSLLDISSSSFFYPVERLDRSAI